MQTKLVSRLKQKQIQNPASWKTQKDLADELCTNQGTVSRLLQGKVRRLSDKTVVALAKFLAIDSSQVQAELNEMDSGSGSPGLSEFNIQDYMLLIADELPYQIYIKNPERRFVWVNRAMLQACNCTKLEELRGQRDEDLFEDPHLSEAKNDDEMVLRGQTIIDQVEFETWKLPTLLGVNGNSPKPRRLRLVITTKKPLYQNGKIIGIIGFTQDYAVHPPSFLRDVGDPWNFAAFDGGIYYQNFKTKRVWCDELFAKFFPDETFKQRFKRVYEPDRPRIINFFKHLIEPVGRNPNETVTSTIDFRAEVKGRLQWFRGTGIGFGDTKARTLICAHRLISDELASQTICSQALLSLPSKNVFLFIEDDKQNYCFMSQSLLDSLGLQLWQVVGKTYKDLGIKLISSSMPRKESAEGFQSKGFLPVIDYEEFKTNDQKKLTLAIVRIPIDSKLLPVWRSAKENLEGRVDPIERYKRGQHTLGMAWDISNDEDLIFDQLSRSAWTRLLDSSADAIYIKTAKGQYTSINQAFAERVEKSKDEIIGKTAKDVFAIDPKLVETIAKEDDSLVSTGIGFTQAFRKRTDCHGKLWYEASNKFAITNPSGVVEYILGISKNVSNELCRLFEEKDLANPRTRQSGL